MTTKMFNLFKAVADLAVGAKSRQDAEYAEFLTFYRSLVEGLPIPATKLFGRMDAEVITKDRQKETYGIELSVADFMWWKASIENDGVRFVASPPTIQRDMLYRLAAKAETQSLSPDERKSLLVLLDQATVVT